MDEVAEFVEEGLDVAMIHRPGRREVCQQGTDRNLLARELEQEGSAVLAFVMGPGFVRTEMTELQVTDPEGRKWLPSSATALEQGRDRPPEDCAQATIRLVQAACPALNGRTFGPDTDFEAVLREARGGGDAG